MLDLLFPFVFHKHYLVRQAACRAIPAVLPSSQIRIHLRVLQQELLSSHSSNTLCGLLELVRMKIQYDID